MNAPSAGRLRRVGSWIRGTRSPRSGEAALREALLNVAHPLYAIELGGETAFATGGSAQLGGSGESDALPLLGHVPALTPDQLGDAEFRAAHGLRYAYVVGEMANGIAGEELVEAAAASGGIGFFGAAGLSVARVEEALTRLERTLGAGRFGSNLIHSPDDPALENAIVDLYLKRGMTRASASAYLDLTLPVVRYRTAGIHRGADGTIVVPNHLMAKVSRAEVARKFLEPSPDSFLSQLVQAGHLTEAQAALARQVPMADDVTAEADSGGHTDNRPLVLLLPAMQALRDEVCAAHPDYPNRPRIGAAGGIATPASVAAAFSMGAAYVMSGSVNQGCREASTSDLVKQMLAQASPSDVAMAPAADMFEMGVKVQVLSRGTLFAARGAKLYELYRSHDSVESLPAAVRAELEQKYFRQTLEQAWQGCEAFFAQRDPAQLERARREPKHQLALLFRSYLGQASIWANDGLADRRADYQVWCGPGMGAFNAWTRGTSLEGWESRRVGVVARNLLHGAAYLTRLAALRGQGVEIPPSADRFSPLSLAELDAFTTPPPPEAEVVKAPRAARATTTMVTKDEPVAIVGMGCMFPSAANVAEFWNLIRTGKDAVTDVPASHWSLADYYDADPASPDKTYAKRGAFLGTHNFDPTEFGIPPSILEATDTSQLLALAVAKMAFDDAGLREGARWNRHRTSVLLGVTGTQELVIALGSRLGHPHWRRALDEAGVDAATAADVVERISRSYVGWQENSFPGLLGNVVAGRIANRFDLGGTNCVIDAACASSLGAVHLGMLELRAGRSDAVLTGGVDCLNDIFMHMCFSKTPALSASGDVRPFSDKADGTLLGEGLGMLVLKRLSDAERDGDRVYASIRSVGTSSDGRAKSIYAPLPSGQARALRDAYDTAGVTPRSIELLEAHGTGTKAGDLAEVEALREVYRADSTDLNWCALGSVKSQVGHTKAAAGAAGLMKAALALHHRVLPPTIKVDAPNPALEIETSPFYLSTEARPWVHDPATPRFAAVSSFGFGGSNFHLVLEEHRTPNPLPAWEGAPEIFAFSAKDVPVLVAQVREAIDSNLNLAAIAAATRSSFRSSDAHRLLAVVRGAADLGKTFAEALARLSNVAVRSFTLPDGIVYGTGDRQGQLAFLFPGQGSQHLNMHRELSFTFPEMIGALEKAADVAWRIYPAPSFDPKSTARHNEALTATDVAQPALATVESGLLGILSRFGVRPDLVAGHSFGELVALRAADVLDEGGLARASALRGRLMRGDGGDRGTMLAVLAPLNEIEQAITDERLELVLANRNTPTQGVLSGSRAEIDRAETMCTARNWRCSRLSVGAAFHSPLVAAASTEFASGLSDIAFGPPRLPVIANTTAEVYPADAAQARTLLAKQLASPVRFDAVVERLHALGARTFLEVGPKSVLSGMVTAILGERAGLVASIDAGSRHGGLADLALALCKLAAAGHAVELTAWAREARRAPTRKQAMVVPLSGANYRAPVTRAMPTPKPPSASTNGVHPPATRNGVHHPAVETHAMAPIAAAPAVRPAASAGVDSALAEALRVNQENVRALQALHEQTARVHQTFLEGQLAAQQRFSQLLVDPRTLLTPRAIAAPASYQPAVAPYLPPTPVFAPPPAPIAAPIAVAAPPVAVAVQPAIDVAAVLLAVVSETTGYPIEALDLKMDLEADLGIDSIKRVEILSLLSKRIPDAPRVNPEKLSELRTLQQVAAFVTPSGAAAGALAPAASLVPAAPITLAAPPTIDAAAILFDVVSELTGYPKETLGLAMDLEADLGIDSIKRVEILSLLGKRIPGAPNANPEKLSGLRTLQQVLNYAAGATPTVSAPAPTPVEPAAAVAVSDAPLLRAAVVPVRAAAPEKPIALAKGDVAVWGGDASLGKALATALTARGVPAHASTDATSNSTGLSGLIVLGRRQPWSSAAEQDVKNAFRAVQSASGSLRQAASTGGALLSTVSRLDGAFGHLGESDREHGLQLALHGLSKTVSHEWPGVVCRALDVAADLSVEAAADLIADELLHAGPMEVGLGASGRIGLGARDVGMTASIPSLAKGELVVVTGGARGVTAACATALAQAHGVELLLLGRSAVGDAEATWLAAAKDEAGIKRALLEHSTGGARPTPRELGDSCRAILAARDIRATLADLASRGVSGTYRAVDIRDAAALAQVLGEATSKHGPVRGIVHGAGVLRDRRIEDKTSDDFDQVFDTKIAGLRALLDIAGDGLRFIALFASVSGRWGRRGQSDYAMANQALVSIAQAEAARLPACRVVALDWGPWDGGMVTPALRKEFQREGVDVIRIEAGARALTAEASIAAGGFTEYLVHAGATSVPAAPWTLLATHRLSVAEYLMLSDHRLGGKYVLPFAIATEWLGQGARRLAPGATLLGVDDVRMLKGITVTTTEPVLSIWAGPLEREGDSWRVKVELRDAEDLPRVRASAVLGSALSAPATSALTGLRPYPHAEVYGARLFHGPSFQVIESISGISSTGLEATLAARPAPGSHINGESKTWITHPLAVDAVFQALILWSREYLAAPCLPSRVASVRLFGDIRIEGPRGIRISVRESSATEVTADADLLDGSGRVLARLEGCVASVSAALERSFSDSANGFVQPPAS